MTLTSLSCLSGPKDVQFPQDPRLESQIQEAKEQYRECKRRQGQALLEIYNHRSLSGDPVPQSCYDEVRYWELRANDVMNAIMRVVNCSPGPCFIVDMDP